MFRVPWDPVRRRQWAVAIRRQTPDGKLFIPSDHNRLCSAHFVKGAPSYDPDDVDYVPRLFFHDEASRERSRRVKSRCCCKANSLRTKFAAAITSTCWRQYRGRCETFDGIVKVTVKFTLFPRNHELKAKWMKVIGRKQWPSKWWTAVCSDHFAPEDFVSGHAALGMLKPKAVPSVFWDKGSPVVTQARRAPRKLPAGSSRIQTIDTASPHGEETNAPESRRSRRRALSSSLR
ncbi:hypothetical protein HPB49_003264 [Dermacentor silvarum]|uniref:Uncharacterized protein n=1 Tax=Dermacentor silvarum TaxID=543639 RepID=A0ACB8CD30_DERSI|nr:hypothetical protein HPB49_003264 [Dermacentor silvarum]